MGGQRLKTAVRAPAGIPTAPQLFHLRAHPNQELELTAAAKVVFDELHAQVLVLVIDESTMEVFRAKSAFYCAADGDFCVALLPRKHHVVALLNLELSECLERDERLKDPAEHNWGANASNTGGVSYHVFEPGHVPPALKLIRQAYGLAAQ